MWGSCSTCWAGGGYYCPLLKCSDTADLETRYIVGAAAGSIDFALRMQRRKVYTGLDESGRRARVEAPCDGS